VYPETRSWHAHYDSLTSAELVPSRAMIVTKEDLQGTADVGISNTRPSMPSSLTLSVSPKAAVESTWPPSPDIGSPKKAIGIQNRLSPETAAATSDTQIGPRQGIAERTERAERRSVPMDPKPVWRNRPDKGAASALMQRTTREDLGKFAHLSVVKAAVAMGIGRTSFKKVCRQVGITSWPPVDSGKLPGHAVQPNVPGLTSPFSECAALHRDPLFDPRMSVVV
jgi:hypothetical protein